MIEKNNIPIQNKLTKRISYILFLDSGWWRKIEYDDRGKEINYENSEGIIKDDR